MFLAALVLLSLLSVLAVWFLQRKPKAAEVAEQDVDWRNDLPDRWRLP